MGLLKTYSRDEMLSAIFWVVQLFALLCLLTGCSKVNAWMGLDDDHFAEEILESAIEDHTGFDIDLTPCSSEDWF